MPTDAIGVGRLGVAESLQGARLPDRGPFLGRNRSLDLGAIWERSAGSLDRLPFLLRYPPQHHARPDLAGAPLPHVPAMALTPISLPFAIARLPAAARAQLPAVRAVRLRSL